MLHGPLLAILTAQHRGDDLEMGYMFLFLFFSALSSYTGLSVWPRGSQGQIWNQLFRF